MSDRFFRLHRFPQETPYGCMYHAVASITGEEAWLEHVEDVSDPRWRIRLAEAGYWLDSLYENRYVPASPDFWRQVFMEHPESGWRMIIVVDGTPPVKHRVGALISPFDDVCYVYESTTDTVHSFTPEEFAESRYGRCYRAEVLHETDLSDFEPEDPYGESYERTQELYEKRADYRSNLS